MLGPVADADAPVRRRAARHVRRLAARSSGRAPRGRPALARRPGRARRLVLHPGDRLVVPSPASGSGSRRGDAYPMRRTRAPSGWSRRRGRLGWLWLVALGVTGILGRARSPDRRGPRRRGPLSPGRGAGLAALLVAAGAALAVGWSLYAAWLTPEVYVGGVTGAEVYALLAGMPGRGVRLPADLARPGRPRGRRLRPPRWGDSGHSRGSAAGPPPAGRGVSRSRWSPAPAPLRCLVPAGAWTLLVAALGLAASALAPAAVLACWSERATARGAAAGAGARVRWCSCSWCSAAPRARRASGRGGGASRSRRPRSVPSRSTSWSPGFCVRDGHPPRGARCPPASTGSRPRCRRGRRRG